LPPRLVVIDTTRFSRLQGTMARKQYRGVRQFSFAMSAEEKERLEVLAAADQRSQAAWLRNLVRACHKKKGKGAGDP